MPAASSDKLRKSKSLFATTLSAGINSGDTTIPLNSVSGLPTDTGVTLTIDKTGTMERVTGTVSGSSLINCTRAVEGTASAHSSGATVEAIFDASQWNDLITAYLVGHTQAGAHAFDSLTAATTNGDLTLAGNGTGKVKINAKYGDITSDTDGATVTFNLATTNKHKVTLGGNRTLALSNASTGQVFTIRLLQDGTGSRTVTWFTTITWAGGVAPTLTTTASKADMFVFVCTGSGTYDGFVVGSNI